MSTPVRIALSIARAWVWLYTWRMPPELSVTRRAEIDSDLWDHHTDAQEAGVRPSITTLEMLLRTCLGVPDDLSWCIEVRQSDRGAARTGRRFMMELSPRQTRWMGISSVAAGAIVLLMFGVVPTLKSYFQTAGIPLPLPTRIVMGMSRHELAEKIGVTHQQTQKYEKGTNRISASRLASIAVVLEKPISYFFEGFDSANPKNADDLPSQHQRMCIEVARNFMRIKKPIYQDAVNVLVRILAEG